MEVVIVDDDEQIGEIAASIVIATVGRKPDAVIGLATGSSPLSTYRRLIGAVAAGEVSFEGARAVTLDEYVGLKATHPESYRNVIRREFVDQIDLRPGRLETPDPHSGDVAQACADYDSRLGTLGVDVQLLGIGTDGHVAFNEPGSSLASRTRIKTLTEQTRVDNARFFDSLDDVPRHVITQGLGTISEARHLVLVASGAGKAAPIAAAVEGPLTASCPATIIQMHPHVTVIVDEAAAADLSRADYYRETYAHKPAWQPL